MRRSPGILNETVTGALATENWKDASEAKTAFPPDGRYSKTAETSLIAPRTPKTNASKFSEAIAPARTAPKERLSLKTPTGFAPLTGMAPSGKLKTKAAPSRALLLLLVIFTCQVIRSPLFISFAPSIFNSTFCDLKIVGEPKIKNKNPKIIKIKTKTSAHKNHLLLLTSRAVSRQKKAFALFGRASSGEIMRSPNVSFSL